MGLVHCKRQRGICQNFAADADGIMWQFSLSEEESDISGAVWGACLPRSPTKRTRFVPMPFGTRSNFNIA